MSDDSNSMKDELVSHWDLDYMTDEQREQWLAEQDRKRHVDAARGEAGNNRLEAHPYAKADEKTKGPSLDWRWTGVAAVLVAGLTTVAWLFTIGPLA